MDFTLLYQGDSTLKQLILTHLALYVLKEKFTVYRGEWDLIAKKSKKKLRDQKSDAHSDILKKVEKL